MKVFRNFFTKKMTKFILPVILVLSILSCNSQPKSTHSNTNQSALVNPFIGTDGPGNTYPGATVPFGMIQLSPDIGISGWDRIAGYYFPDTIISGFSHTHLSGTGAGDLYDILIMPTNSKYNQLIPENNYRPHSRFTHQRESAQAGYYSVELLDYGIFCELTATERTGIHRYTFPKDSMSLIHIDLGYALNWDSPTDTYIEVVDNQTINGYRKSTGWAKDQRIYFQIKLSKPFSSFSLFKNNKEISGNKARGPGTRITLQFQTTDQESIVLKTGLSTADIEGAALSIQKESPHYDFELYRHSSNQKWNQQLQKVIVKSINENYDSIFYTMLYQSMLAPTLLSDLNGNYKGANGEKSQAIGYDRYDTFSLWDTYRAAHPLFTILHPQRVSDMIQSLLAHYNETGLLPVWSLQGNESNMMIGYHAIPVIVDAYFKGIKFDQDLAYQACVASAMDNGRQIDQFKKLGYIPTDEHHENWSVSKTLEYAYDDWCLAIFAKDLEKQADYEYFLSRSKNWINLYDPKSKFFRPKDANGQFIPDFRPKDYSTYFCESNAWQYFWSVQHDIEKLIVMTGGKKAFEQKLDTMFSLTPLPEDKLPIFSTGMIGQYAHGNEPSHHVAYLYNYVDRPDKTQQLIRKILTTQYKNQPDGHCGNEDCGQMSSWYVFSSMGFYPVNPAQGIYVLGSPLVKEAILQLENGNTFHINTVNQSKDNCYIHKIELNGKVLRRYYLSHEEIIAGGTLTFFMANQPKKDLPAQMIPSSRIEN